MTRMCQSPYRLFATALLAASLGLVVPAAPAAADQPPWEPMAPPAEIDGRVEILTLAIDASGSMREGRNLSPRARSAGRHAIADSERCTYVIVAMFGNEARVVADRFACTDHDRQVLFDAVETVAMNDTRTDVRVLEELLSHVQDAVTARYSGRGFRMRVQILTDGQPDPIDRSEPQSFDIILEQRTTRSDLAEGLWLYRLAFDIPASGPVREPASSTHVSTLDAESTGANLGRIGIVAGMAFLALLASIFIAARRRAQREAEEVLGNTGSTQQAQVVPLKSPAGLQVTEWRVSPKGDRALVQGPMAVRYTPNRPVTLGADEGRVVVALRSPGISARLASITLDGRGGGVVTPLNGKFRFDGQEVQRGLPFTTDHTHVLAVGCTELHLGPVSVLPETEDALYQRLGENSSNGVRDGDAEKTHDDEVTPDRPMERETA